eukprot:7923299-Heterocapsa_arctica.AAC.1
MATLGLRGRRSTWHQKRMQPATAGGSKHARNVRIRARIVRKRRAGGDRKLHGMRETCVYAHGS